MTTGVELGAAGRGRGVGEASVRERFAPPSDERARVLPESAEVEGEEGPGRAADAAPAGGAVTGGAEAAGLAERRGRHAWRSCWIFAINAMMDTTTAEAEAWSVGGEGRAKGTEGEDETGEAREPEDEAGGEGVRGGGAAAGTATGATRCLRDGGGVTMTRRRRALGQKRVEWSVERQTSQLVTGRVHVAAR